MQWRLPCSCTPRLPSITRPTKPPHAHLGSSQLLLQSIAVSGSSVPLAARLSCRRLSRHQLSGSARLGHLSGTRGLLLGGSLSLQHCKMDTIKPAPCPPLKRKHALSV